MGELKSLCVFCGSSDGEGAVYRSAAEALGRLLAEQGIQLVYGGAQVGLMGRIADAALQAGGKVVGVIPGALFPKEIPHPRLTQLHVVASMHERKQLMYELSDGFAALPGGIGTLEELFEIFTWGQLGLHAKPCALLNIDGYFDALLDFLDASVAKKFLKPKHRDLLRAYTDPLRLLEGMRSFQPQELKKWIGPKES